MALTYVVGCLCGLAIQPNGYVDRRTAVLGASAAAMARAAPASAAAATAAARQLGICSGKISGQQLPLTVGLGTCLVRDGQAPLNMRLAIDAGYRVFDTPVNPQGPGSSATHEQEQTP